ncbi:hypothetical protein EUGRSUZ_B02767 [Eucalyptus grandis]|uniref:Uncharacterized protein n=2 Tax=Eucalyptus grandis TaxID=71139 RepID=A0ACC3M2F2_EUCGR|nr:hypothetical protein EUGRSUZ_B02767 [Eucalyptus grandis]
MGILLPDVHLFRMATYLKILGHKSRVERGIGRSSEMAESDDYGYHCLLEISENDGNSQSSRRWRCDGEQGWLT